MSRFSCATVSVRYLTEKEKSIYYIDYIEELALQIVLGWVRMLNPAHPQSSVIFRAGCRRC